MQAGGKSTGKKTLSPEEKARLAQRIARDAHAQLHQQNPATAGNRDPATPTAAGATATVPTGTAPTITPPIIATPSGPFGTWLAAQPGPPAISKAQPARYMTSVVNPKVQTVVAKGSQYDYVNDVHKAVVTAYQDLPRTRRGRPPGFAADHVDNLVETVDSILETVGSVERKVQTREAQTASAQAETAQNAALAGDGGYPVGTIEGSGESTTMVVSIGSSRSGPAHGMSFGFSTIKTSTRREKLQDPRTRRLGRAHGYHVPDRSGSGMAQEEHRHLGSPVGCKRTGGNSHPTGAISCPTRPRRSTATASLTT